MEQVVGVAPGALQARELIRLEEHGWHGDVLGLISGGVDWLERHYGKARKRKAGR